MSNLMETAGIEGVKVPVPGLRLYEMEERLADCDFLRIAKGCIVNFRAITALKPDGDDRITATLEGRYPSRRVRECC